MEKEKVLEVEFMQVWNKWAWRFTKFEFPEGIGEIEDSGNTGIAISRYHTDTFTRSDIWTEEKHDTDDYELIDDDEKEDLIQFVDFVNEKYGKPKRWRADFNKVYYYVTSEGRVDFSTDIRCEHDDSRYSFGNHFKTEEEAVVYAEKIIKVLEENR